MGGLLGCVLGEASLGFAEGGKLGGVLGRVVGLPLGVCDGEELAATVGWVLGDEISVAVGGGSSVTDFTLTVLYAFSCSIFFVRASTKSSTLKVVCPSLSWENPMELSEADPASCCSRSGARFLAECSAGSKFRNRRVKASSGSPSSPSKPKMGLPIGQVLLQTIHGSHSKWMSSVVSSRSSSVKVQFNIFRW